MGEASFGAIIGHERILALLPRLHAQTLLFSGPERVGRRTVARWYALGLERGFPPPWPGVPEGYREVGPRTPGGEVLLEEVEELADWLATPSRLGPKVGVLDGAHRLTEAAGNALLKLLEEPPSYARLILIAPARATLLPTLASRALEVPFAPVPLEALKALTEDPWLLAYAGGAPGRLIRALADLEGLKARLALAQSLPSLPPLKRLEALKGLLEDPEAFHLLHAALRDRPHLLPLLEKAREALEDRVHLGLVGAWLALSLRG